MKENQNPFVIYQYAGPEYFCDRVQELSKLIEAFKNQRYIVLYAMRRLGKSGLIHHFHHHLNKNKNTVVIYCDVQNTKSDSEFVAKLIASSVAALEKSNKGVMARIGKYFASLRPIVSFDPATSLPTIELQIINRLQVESSLDALMTMLGDSKKKIQIAIDEFQQITQYEQETSIDATLRGYIHKIPNVHFVFSGSQRHLLAGIFSNVKKPFYNAVDQLQLQPIDRQIYSEFIFRQFQLGKQSISTPLIHDILDWTRAHTYHTQYFCNRLYSKSLRDISDFEIEITKKEIIFSYEQNYLQLRAVLSRNQWKVLAGIAKEGSVKSVTNKEFLTQYKLALSSADQAVKVLLEKELIYANRDIKGSELIVYDPFFSRWLELF